MPKTIKLEPHLDSNELENLYRKARDRVLRSHYQILWLISEGKSTTHTESGCILPSMSERRNTQKSEQAESRRLERLYRKATDPVLRTHLLMVWRVSLGEPVGEVARMVGYSLKWTR